MLGTERSDDPVGRPEDVPVPRHARQTAILLLLLGIIGVLLPGNWPGLSKQWTDVIFGVSVALIASAVLVLTADYTRGSWVILQVVERVKARLGTVETRLEDRFEQLSALDTSHITMVYPTRKGARSDMANAIRGAAQFVYLMGISLNEFFIVDEQCKEALEHAYRAGKKVSLLVLNNRSANALERANREEGAEWTKVTDHDYETKAKLFRETAAAITGACSYHRRAGREGLPDLKIYDNQSTFLLITDKVAFIEPYHWGDRLADEEYQRLAELVPLLRLEQAQGDDTSRPYEQFKGHFEYMYRYVAMPWTNDNLGPSPVPNP